MAYVYNTITELSMDTYTANSSSISGFDTLGTYGQYEFAKTDLTNINVNELFEGKKVYGASGVVEGDGSIYNNLDYNKISLSGFTSAKVRTDLYSNSTFGSISYKEDATLNRNQVIGIEYDNIFVYARQCRYTSFRSCL